MLTNVYTFKAEFKNSTHGNIDVHTDSGKSTFYNNTFDGIRGLAYFRQNLFDTYVVEESPDISFVINNDDTLRYALSADGTVMLATLGEYIYVYRHREQKFEHEITNDSGTRPKIYERYPGIAIGEPVAISGDAKRCVVVRQVSDQSSVFNQPVIKVFDLKVDLSGFEVGEIILTVPSEYNNNGIHNVCMSMDGNTILISGGGARIVATGNFVQGYAHVYNYNIGANTWSTGINLSSSTFYPIPITVTFASSPDQFLDYGIDSCLSGDGRTIVIITTNGNLLIWKFDFLSQTWIFLQTLRVFIQEPIAPCSLSHNGDTFFVTSPRNTTSNNYRWYVFEYNAASKQYDEWRMPEGQGYYFFNDVYNMASGSMSGDGKTVVIAEHKRTQNVYTGKQGFRVTVYTKSNNPGLDSSGIIDSSGYTAKKTIIEDLNISLKDGLSSISSTVLVSFDGGTILLGSTVNTINENMVTFINGKQLLRAGDTVFDYLNERSTFGGIDYAEINIDRSQIQETSYANISAAHYGTVDALSMSAYGRIIIIGSPETNEAYLYDDEGITINTFTGTSRFGIRCSMDDLGDIIVIASNTHLYIYDGSTYAEITTISHSTGVSEAPWNMKISKDGSTIIASNNVNSKSFKSWYTTNKWDTHETTTYDSTQATNVSVSAIDLSADGTVIIAAGLGGHVNLFSRGTVTEKVYLKLPDSNAGTNLSTGQSIALSGDGTKAIVGAPNPTYSIRDVSGHLADSKLARVFFIDIDRSTSTWTMSPQSITVLQGTAVARYGRSVSIDYNGNYAMVSGVIGEYPDSGAPADGSAILIDTSNKTILNEFPGTSLTYNPFTPQWRPDWNGYGIHCKLSSHGDVVAVSGGGYASLFYLGS